MMKIVLFFVLYRNAKAMVRDFLLSLEDTPESSVDVGGEEPSISLDDNVTGNIEPSTAEFSD